MDGNTTPLTENDSCVANREMDEQKIEVWLSREHVILKKGSHSLWCSRRDGSLLPGRGKI